MLQSVFGPKARVCGDKTGSILGEFLDRLNSSFRRTAPWLSLTEVRRLTN